MKFSTKKSNPTKAITRALSSSLRGSPGSPRPSRSASMEGWLRKRTTKSGVRKVWCERYFVLRGSTLSYYDRQMDTEPKATFELSEGCKVSDIYLGSRKEKGGDGSGGGTNHEHDDDSVDATGVSTPDTSKRSKKGKSKDGKSKEGKKKEKLYCIKVTWPVPKAQSKDEKEADRVVEAITGGDAKSAKTPMTKSSAVDSTPDRKARASINASRSHSRHASTSSALTDKTRNTSRLSPKGTPRNLTSASAHVPRTPPRVELTRSRSAEEFSTPDGAVENDNYVSIQSPSPSEDDMSSAVSPPTTPSATTQAPKSPRSSSLTYKPSAPMVVSPPSMSHSYHDDALSPSTTARLSTLSPSHRRAPSEGEQFNFSDIHPPRMGRASTITEGVPAIPTLGSNAGSPVAIKASASSDSQQEAATAGLQRHYEEQLNIQRQEEEDEKKVLSSKTSKQQQEEMYKLLYLAAKKATQKKYKKRVVTGTKIAAATGAAITAGALTAGVGLVAGLVFVGIAGGLSGTGAAAGAAIGRGPGNKKLVLAAASLEDALAWKEALENAINEIASEGDEKARGLPLSESSHQIEDASSTWRHMFEREGRRTSSITRATAEEKTEEAIETVRSLDGIGGGVGAADVSEEHILREDSGIQPVQHEVAQTGAIFEPGARWRPLEVNWATLLGTGVHGLRIFCEEKYPQGVLSGMNVSKIFRSRVGVEGHPSPPLKAHVVVDASPLNAFMCLMCNGRIQSEHGSDNDNDAIPLVPNSGQVASFRVIKTLDDHMDIIHLVMRPLYLFPSWTAPRDFVLVRYWRLEADGSYVVCYDSIEHRDCPPTPGYVRGGLHSVFTIAPRKRTKRLSESLLTHVVQVDPHGWVPTFSLPLLANHGYVEAFQVSALLQMVDVRDALDHDRFVSVSLDARPHKHWSSLKSLYTKAAEETSYPAVEREPAEFISRTSSVESEDEEVENADNYDFSYATHERPSVAVLEAKNRFSDGASVVSAPESVNALNTISNDPPPLVTDWWSEPDANSFRVRGKMYKKDKKKFNAGDSLFRLIATDIISVDASIFDGICHHPQERVQRALKREKKLKTRGLPSDMPPFVVCINIVLPGPPYYHFATYYAVDDMSLIDGSDGTPSSKLANEFFFGDSDEFRHQTFKLIPQIVEGNFIVRKAVGSTPAIMGTKLKQTYVRTDRFFEIVLDIGSSSVAAGVIRICSGYAKQIVVDMAFLLEGNDETTLPERVFGTVRLKNIEFGKKLRFLQTADVEVDDDE